MSAERITLFTCDRCGTQELSPANYELPEGWNYEKPAGQDGRNLCKTCKRKQDLREAAKKAANKDSRLTNLI